MLTPNWNLLPWKQKANSFFTTGYWATAVAVFGCFATASVCHAQLNLTTAPVITSVNFNTTLTGPKVFDGVAGANNRWATTFTGNAPTNDTSERNEWLLVDLGVDVNIGKITMNWETARAEDYTWRIRTAAQGLPGTPTQGNSSSVTYSDWTEIAKVDTALSVGANINLATPDQTFNWDAGTATTTNGADGPITLTTPTATGRYLLLAITDNWFRTGTGGTGSSCYEVVVFPSTVGIVPGDTDGNGTVDQADYQNIRNNFRSTIPFGTSEASARLMGDITSASGSLNRDGVVNFYDFIAWQSHFPTPGAGSSVGQVPEPVSLALLGLGGVAFVSVRRRK